MDSNKDGYEKYSKDPDKLIQDLGDRIEEISQVLDDDENFCKQDIDATIKYVQTIEKKFSEKIQEFKDKLEQLRMENAKTSEKNKKRFNDEMQEVNDLFSDGHRYEAWKKFQDYEKCFTQRATLIQHIPKLPINESDIEQYFSADYKTNKPSPIQPTTVISSTITTIDDEKQDYIDDRQLTDKERKRNEKVIETVHIDKNNDDFSSEKTEQNVDNPLFGIRSKLPGNQQTITTNEIKKNGINPPATTVSSGPRFGISTRLGPLSNTKNLQFSGRDISASSSVQNTNPISQRQINNNGTTNNLTLIPVSHYQHERNIFLLTACNIHYIILFKSQRNRLDRWHLGAIERRHHIEHSLDWHDGLIISMGYIGNNQIYMFTEREFFIYSLSSRRKLDTRILPRGNDDGFEITNSSSNENQRGIGTVYDKYMYHIYLNRNSRWTLSKHYLDKLVHLHDYDLTRLFPDVLRFIHLCVNEKRIHFLVQMNDLSYAVVFCSTSDCQTNDSILPLILLSARQPLTIYSAFISSINREILFINDPSIDILHLLTSDKYLQSYSVLAHAICYVADKHELIIVTNNSICAINLNEENKFFSKFLSDL